MLSKDERGWSGPVGSLAGRVIGGDWAVGGIAETYRESRVTTPLEAAAFWLAVVLPFLYGPLVVMGPGTPAEWRALVVLLVINAVALLAGHGHRP